MKIDEKWSVVFDENNAILRFEEIRQRKNKETQEETDYSFREDYYYPNLHTALIAYLHKSLEPAEDVKDCVRLIDQAIDKIKNHR